MNSPVKEKLQLTATLPEGSKKQSRPRKATSKNSNGQSKQSFLSETTTPPSSTKQLSSITETTTPFDSEYAAEDVVFKPNPGPQTSFLAAAEREVLYGGSAGGGKSYAMLADPLRYMYHPQFSGLLLRHTTEELRELIWKSQEIYPKIIPGIKWSERRMQWEAPSGAKLWMSFLDRDEDVMRYQGLSFCVAENTPIALADGTFIPIKDVAVGDKVATLEGSNSVIFKSQKLKKKCVRVDVYSSDGALLSSQIQPYNHPIALLSSKPLNQFVS